MREYEERREIENFYEKAKKRIKEQIEMKGVSCKGSAKGLALSEIIAVIDEEMEINIAEELVTARRALRAFCDKYNHNETLERKLYENERKLEEQKKAASIVEMLTDETLKNAIIAYNPMTTDRYNRGDAKEITIAYLQAKGRADLKEKFEKSPEEGENG